MTKQKIKRVIYFFNPSIPKDEAITKVWKKKEAIFSVTVFDGELEKEYGNTLWNTMYQVEDTIIKLYSQITPYWAVFENKHFRKSSY